MAATKTERKPVTFEDGWPVDADGQPMVKISFSEHHLVPTGNYANTTIGPAQATKFVVDNENAVSAGYSELADQVEDALGYRIQAVLDEINA